MNNPDYGLAHIENLEAFEEGLRDAGIDAEPVRSAIEFLRKRLTEAAIHGCHHCDEGNPDEQDEPCWHCGLKRMLD